MLSTVDYIGLMAEFNARIDAEGGKTNFLIKSQVNEAKKGAQETAQKVQYAGEDAVDAVGGLFGKLNPQQAFMKGKLKIKGNMGLAMKLGKVMEAAK